jgi:hypothetical protein
MDDDSLLKLRNATEISPIFESRIGGAIPLFVERSVQVYFRYCQECFSASQRRPLHFRLSMMG